MVRTAHEHIFVVVCLEKTNSRTQKGCADRIVHAAEVGCDADGTNAVRRLHGYPKANALRAVVRCRKGFHGQCAERDGKDSLMRHQRIGERNLLSGKYGIAVGFVR